MPSGGSIKSIANRGPKSNIHSVDEGVGKRATIRTSDPGPCGCFILSKGVIWVVVS